jgi:hypothetical protein
LNAETGAIEGSGWAVNRHLMVNQVASKSHFADPYYNNFMKRNINAILFQTPLHQFFILFPLDLGVICKSSITVFERAKGPSSG